MEGSQNSVDARKDDPKDSEEKVRLRREFGLFQGVSVIVGLVIGKRFYLKVIFRVEKLS